MSLTIIGSIIFATVLVGIAIPVMRRLGRTERSRIARDIQLELPALERIDSMVYATAADQQRMLNIMSARRELPSYVSEETVAEGVDAVVALIERTSYLRKQGNRPAPAAAKLPVSA